MKMRLVAVAMAVAVPGAAKAAQKTVVPAFFLIEQKTNGTTTDWNRIANQGNKVLAVVALGDVNGLETATDPELSNAKSQFGTNWNSGNGQPVLGYVYAGFACTSTGNLQGRLSDAETGPYGVSKWYTTYPTQIQGIFFDVGPQLGRCYSGDLNGLSPQSELTQKQYYSGAYSYVGTNHTGAKVMLNAAGFENDWVVAPGSNKSADYAVIFETDYSAWYNTYKAEDGSSPGWWTSGYQGLLANVVWGATQYDITGGVSQSQTSAYGSPVLYLYDGTSKGYDHVSCSFETQVALLQGTTPVPTATTYCAGGSNQCKNLDTSGANCGTCGHACTSNFCGSGSCYCSQSQIDTCNHLGKVCEPDNGGGPLCI